jgi:hypothetical protein
VSTNGTDPLHCGACSTACAASQICVAGACRETAPAVGCTTCPCTTCGAILGVAATCCASFPGQDDALCVAGTACK